MRTTHRPDDEPVIGRVFDTTAVAVGSVYLTSHSVGVTLIATVAAVTVSGGAIWLRHRKAADQQREANEATLREPVPDAVEKWS